MEELPTAIPAECLPLYESPKKQTYPVDFLDYGRKQNHSIEPSLRISAIDEIKRIEQEERMLEEERATIEAKQRELIDKKADIEAEALLKEEDAANSTKIYHDIRALEIARSKVPFASNLSSEILLAAQIDQKNLHGNDREAAELLRLARLRQMKRNNYINLASMLVFCTVYSVTLLTQRDTVAAFDIESRSNPNSSQSAFTTDYEIYGCSFSVIFSGIMASLPTGGAGSSIFHGSTPGTNGLLSSNDDFYNWLGQNVLSVLFQDAECGDGICESPEEVPGVGRFGWWANRCVASNSLCSNDVFTAPRIVDSCRQTSWLPFESMYETLQSNSNLVQTLTMYASLKLLCSSGSLVNLT